jgi:hypothetical protein
MSVYDAFTGTGLDPDKWVPGVIRHGEHVVWSYADPGLATTVRDGVCELAIERFKLCHHSVQMFDNPKALYISLDAWPVALEPLRFGCNLAAQFSGDVADYRNGFASFNVLDFATGTVMDIVSNGHQLWAITERLDIPGMESAVAPFTEVIDLAVETAPLTVHAIEVVYDAAAHEVRYSVDGQTRYTRHIPTSPQCLSLGMGLITLYPLENGLSTSCRGQGGLGRFSEITAPG